MSARRQWLFGPDDETLRSFVDDARELVDDALAIERDAALAYLAFASVIEGVLDRHTEEARHDTE